MSAPVFLLEGDVPVAAGVGDEITLGGEEGRHAAVVRRIQVGEPVELTDGHGLLLRTVVGSASREGLRCTVVERLALPRPAPSIVVVQALAKGERGELAVETCTEVGADEVVPWAAARSVVQWRGERGERALVRWRSTAREAAKQSRRAWFPEVTEPVTTAGVVRRLRAAALGVVLHEAASAPLAAVTPPDVGEIVLVVGPEGGITDEELAAFAAAGAQPVRLGPSVLRTSTAGAVAAAVVLARTPRWS